MNAAESTPVATAPDLRRWLSHYRFGLRGLSLFLILLGLAPLAIGRRRPVLAGVLALLALSLI